MKPLAHSLAFLICLAAGDCRAETATACNGTVDVKYRGAVNLDHFSCEPVERSSFIRCVCYDPANAYMIVGLNGTFYHYCGVDKATVDSFKAADSMGRFFNAAIKGHFDCRTGRVPAN
jgi:uncharacterized membrane protein